VTEHDAVLERVRAAAGGDTWRTLRTIRTVGTVSAGGLSGPYEQLVVLKDGRSVTSLTLGPATATKGFDGSAAWQRSPTGEVSVQDSDAGIRAAATDAYLNARGYFFTSRWDAATEALEPRTDNGVGFDVIRVAPVRGQPVDLWFNRDTHLLDRSVLNIAGTVSVKRFADYRRVGGIWLPFRTTTGGGDPRYDVVVELSEVTLDAQAGDAAFAAPLQTFDDVRILGGGPGSVVPIDVVNNHIYLSATVNGHALRFLLDTGGVNLLTTEAAARAGVRTEGAFEARGPGEKSVSAGFTRLDELVIGGKIALDRQLFRVLPMPGFEQVEGTPMDGLLGFEVFKRLTVQIDYVKRTCTFTLPAEFTPPPEAVSLPLTFYAHHPSVSGTLDGCSGQFWLDTGNRNALTLWAPFVEAHRLATRYPVTPETTIGWGVGGSASGRVARGGVLTLGEIKVRAPVLTLAGDSVIPIRDVAGNIGGDLLRRFLVTLDYSRKVVHLQSNSPPEAPFYYDRAGMWINRHGRDFLIRAVLANGPAADADLRVNDIITTIDGRSAASLELDAVRRSLRESPAGTELVVEVLRAATPLRKAVRLRDLIPGD
jgi:PDZ domain/Aspartyl protease